MKKNRLYSTCMCCGLQEKEEYYFYDCNDYGTLAICRCCGCQSGNNDFDLKNLLMYRYEWEKGKLHWQNGNPNLWFDDVLNDTQPRVWDKQQQMQNIPRHLLINSFPLYALTPRERGICRICGYDAEEINFFYDEQNRAKYKQCPCCEGISGCDDATLKDTYFYRYKFAHPSNLTLQNVPQDFLQPQPSFVPNSKEINICRICGYEAKGEDLLYDESGYLMEALEQGFFYDEEGYPKYRYCPCCGGQSGYDDFELKGILRGRYIWIESLGGDKPSLIITREGRSWREKMKCEDWTLHSQLQNIPKKFLRSPFPLLSKEKTLCRICGYDGEELFYDEEGYPKYRYCPCCGGQSGYDDFDTHCIESRHKAWKMFLKDKNV